MKDLRLQESAAERFARAEHALYYPTIGVVGTAGFVPTGHDNGSRPLWRNRLNVTIPIFNGGLFQGPPDRGRTEGQSGHENVNDLQNRVTRDVRVAWLNATTAYDRMGLTQELLEQANSALDLAQTRYDLGLGTIVELSQAQLNLTSAQIANTSAHYEYQTQRIVLDYQTGVLH